MNEKYSPDGSASPVAFLSWERWNNILRCKKSFFEDPEAFPCDCPNVNPDVVASWKRCWETEIDPRKNVYIDRVDEEKYRSLQEEHAQLLAVCTPLLAGFRSSLIDCHVSLIDRNGVVLQRVGSFRQQTRFDKVLAEGLIWSEETVGTTSHSLAVRHRRPVQMLGAEYYSNAFNKIMVSTAVPILDENDEAEAALTLVYRQDRASFIESRLENDLLRNSLNMITALASAISAQKRLRSSHQHLVEINASCRLLNEKLRETSAIQAVAMAGIEHGILTIDHDDRIIQCNRAAGNILGIDADRPREHNLGDFLLPGSALLSAVSRPENDQLEERLLVNGRPQSCVINVWPIVDREGKTNAKAVLRLQPAVQYFSNVAKKSGNLASCNFSDIIGESQTVRNAIALGRKFAGSQENILLVGESGTGKEMFAQSIHNAGNPQGPFIVLNCSAIPRSLVESELFGYEGGSFTGADKRGRPGKIELANGGTLFLDEIGDMPFEIQAVLLRVLQDKQVMRIGSSYYKKVHFRVIAATNRDLPELVKKGMFREDLFFRLSVLLIRLPSLRGRGQDAELLAEHFTRSYCAKMNWRVPTLTPEAREFIRNGSWPGNVRQLENALIYAINASQGDDIRRCHLESNSMYDSCHRKTDDAETPTPPGDPPLPLTEYEKRAIRAALESAKGNIPQAADVLHISKSTLYRKMREYALLP